MKLASIVLLAIGVGLFLYSMTMPAFTDAAEKKTWDAAASDHIGKDDWEQFTREYYAAVSTLRTNKYSLSDLGVGITSFALLLLGLSAFLKLKSLGDLRRLRSVKRWQLVVIANVAWLATIPASIVYYTRTQVRGDYPWFADSIGIPLFTSAAATLLLLPVLNLIVAGFLRRSQHPAPLNSRFSKYGASAVFGELFIGLVLCLAALALFGAITSGDFIGIPICATLIYVLLSLRAGKANRNGGEPAPPPYGSPAAGSPSGEA